jgi:uncharacterized protein (TIGR02271 family)
VGGDTARVEETVDTGPDAVRGDSDRIRLHEEELQVGTRQVEAGRVRLRKVIRTEHQEVPVELRREEIEIERLPASGNDLGDAAFQEQEINVSAMREEPVVGKQVRAKEDVRLTKTVETGTESVGADVRREDVTVDTDRSDLLDDSSRT